MRGSASVKRRIFGVDTGGASPSESSESSNLTVGVAVRTWGELGLSLPPVLTNMGGD